GATDPPMKEDASVSMARRTLAFGPGMANYLVGISPQWGGRGVGMTAAGDFDGDGKIDIAFMEVLVAAPDLGTLPGPPSGTPQWHFLRGTGTGRFSGAFPDDPISTIPGDCQWGSLFTDGAAADFRR